jgi:hypothetical protein
VIAIHELTFQRWGLGGTGFQQLAKGRGIVPGLFTSNRLIQVQGIRRTGMTSKHLVAPLLDDYESVTGKDDGMSASWNLWYDLQNS